MEHYFELSLGGWLYVALIIIVVAFVVYLNWKDENNYKKSIEPDETNASVRYRQTEILEYGIELSPGQFYLADDPCLMVDDTIIHIN